MPELSEPLALWIAIIFLSALAISVLVWLYVLSRKSEREFDHIKTIVQRSHRRLKQLEEWSLDSERRLEKLAHESLVRTHSTEASSIQGERERRRADYCRTDSTLLADGRGTHS